MELDTRELGGENFHAHQIINELEQTRIQIARMIEDQGGSKRVTLLTDRGTVGGQAQTIHSNGPG